ncbi:MAG TPA: outer membrane protein assembly factor BamA [Desulfobaccales bacterium]
MLRRLILSFLLLALALTQPARAQEEDVVLKKVAVFPFTVASREPLESLGDKVRQDIEDRLKSDSFSLVPQQDLKKELPGQKEALDDARAKEIGHKLGADVVIYGSLIKVGDALSLEARLIDVSGRVAAPFTPKVQGTGLNALGGMSKQLAQELSLKILGKERVAHLDVKGNRRIEKDAILGTMQTREGETVNPARLREDLKAVYKMGYFTDVKMDITDTPNGVVLTVLVKEKPAIRTIITKGNRKVKKKDIQDVMDIKPFSVASDATIQDNINKIKKMYREKGFYEVQITYELAKVTNTEVDLVLHINEGGKMAIKEISFTGNDHFKAKELRGVMETKEKSWLFVINWLSGTGKLAKDTLERDQEKLSAFYYNHGFIKAKIGDPKIDIKGDYIYITVPIQEGPQYKVGKIDLTGDLLEDKEKLLGKIETPKKKIYSREVLQADLTTLSDLYADKGFANADVTPLIKENDQALTVDVTFDIHKGSKVYFERINIAGNIKTRDKVIRRELRVYEQELFSATNLKESIKNLRRLEYFEDVNFSTSPGSSPDHINLKITVKERPTGTFGLGAGYSTQDRLVGMVEVSQNNLFGRGQQVKVQGIIGSISHRFRASFTEPYLFDRPLALGVDAFNWERAYDEYTRISTGGDLRLSHPLKWQYTRLYWMYRYEYVNLQNLAANSSPIILEAAKIHNTSATSFTLRRDSRDSTFSPTKGSDNSLSAELAGLGGDVAFLRYIAESGWYFPWKWNTVAVLHGRVGYMQRMDWGQMPVYEKFYLGGIETIRGFKYAEISPRDPRTGERIGGDSFIQLNAEYRFPIYKKLGLIGTVFVDAGNVYGTDMVGPFLRPTSGVGVRWYSPMGPLRVEWGYNLTKHPWERTSAWEFTMGGTF